MATTVRLWHGLSGPASLLRLRRTWNYVIGLLGAALLAAIVTILLARLANSQFVIQVTIRDFWGAVAIGFIANYIGRKMLDRMVPDGKPG